jgi:hypothetical protein
MMKTNATEAASEQVRLKAEIKKLQDEVKSLHE